MAIKLQDGTVFRNLEEQVQYLTNYHDVNQGIAQWGIRVIGKVDTVEELNEIDTTNLEYGDAVAVGTESPFFFYIWTRASIEGQPAYWFPFGEISAVGPQGPIGPQGPKGDKGEATRIFLNAQNNDPKIGDIWIDPKNGAVYKCVANEPTPSWLNLGNIRGPQGIQGPQGPKGDQGEQGPVGPAGPQGDVGGFINIWGIVNTFDEGGNPILPYPATLNNLTAAYLVEHAGGTDQSNDHYDLYVQVGESSATAVWENAGAFNAATLVTQGGVGLNVWDADTKLDKNTSVTNHTQVYAKNPDGRQAGISVSAGLLGNAIPLRNIDGSILVPLTPSVDRDAASKGYVDLQAAYRVQKVTTSTDENQVYGKTDAGEQYMFNVSRNALGTSIAQRTANGQVRVGTPSRADDAANKQYVDNNDITGTYKEIQANLAIKLEPDSYYMVFCNSPLLSIKNKDMSDVVSGAKQLQFITARIDGAPNYLKVCGQSWTGSSLGGVEGFRRTVDINGYIHSGAEYFICRLGKPATT